MERVYCHVIPPIWTTRHPDMAAGWLTRYVRHHGWEVELFDLNIELYHREHRPHVKYCWEQLYAALSPEQFTDALFAEHREFIRARIQQVLDRGCRVFGLMLTTGNARVAAALSGEIRDMAPDAHIVAGGAGATSLYRYRRRYGRNPPLSHQVERDLQGGHAIDSWVLGEGELTLVELLDRLERGEDLHGIRGLALEADGPHARFAERALIREMDSLPLVDYEGFDLGLYGFRALPFQLSRGCAVARCAHCGLKGYSRGFRVRSPAHAIAEIEQNIERHGIREFHFVDLGANGDPLRLEQFCDELIRRQLDIRWQVFLYIQPDTTPELLRKIVASGCRTINYGFESGSDAVLRTMRKRYTSEDAARVLRLTREAGGRTIVNLMVGHPGEGERELQETLDFLQRNAANIDMVAAVAVTEVQIHSALLDERDALGVQLVGSDGGWRSVDGSIDWRVRNERAHRLTEHLRMLGVPCHEAYWEPPPGEGYDEAAAPEVSREAVTITAVEITAPEMTDEGTCSTGLPVLVHAGYRADPAVRWVVFDLEVTDPEGQPVFTTPPGSFRLRAVEPCGEGYVRMAFGPFDLPPGELLFTITARTLAEHGPAYDRQVHRRPTTLLGNPARKAPMMTPFTWTHQRARLDPGSLPLEQVRLHQGEQSDPLTLQANGAPWRVEVHLRGRDGQVVEGPLQLSLFSADGDLEHRTRGESLRIDDQRQVWRHELDAGRLTPGRYILEVEAPGTDGPVRTRHLVAVGPPPAGLALLRPRPRWRDAAPERPLVLRRGEPLAGEGPVAPGERVTLVLGAELPDADRSVGCRFAVDDPEGQPLARGTIPGAGSPGSIVGLELELELNLLDGSYSLGAVLCDEQSGESVGVGLRRTVRVESSSRGPGGGIVHAPHRMIVRPTR